MLMAKDKQTQEGTSSSMRGLHFHNIISQAARATSAERLQSAVPASCGLRGARQDGQTDRPTEDSQTALPPHAGSQTYRRSATQT